MTERTDDEIDAQLDEQLEQVRAEAAETRRRAAEIPRVQTHDLASMLSTFAYLKAEDKVVDLSKPWLAYSRQAFRNLTAASTRTIVGPRGAERQVPIADDWWADAGRIDVQTMTFRPNAPRLTRDLHDREAINMWSPPKIAADPLPDDWEGRAELFHSHMQYLVPDAAERRNVVRWLAHRMQKPEVLPGWHLLLVAEQIQGTGRNWVARTMKAIQPEYVVESLPLKRILDGHFNSELDRGVLGIVDEIREGGGDYWKHAEALKSFLSEKTRVINAKYRAPYETQNFLGVMMFSNHIDALPLDSTDRRIYVAQCTTEPKDADYFDLIYDALKDRKTLRAIYEALMRVDLKGFAIEARAPASAVKLEMINESRSDEETELRRIVAEWPSDVMRSATLRMMLQKFRDNDLLFGEDRHKSDQLSTGQLRRLYRVCGVKAHTQIKMMHVDHAGRRMEEKFRTVVLRNYKATWMAASADQLREEIERGELEHDRRLAEDLSVKPEAKH